MPTYTGSFPLVAQGQAVTVKLDGVSLTDPAPGNVGSAVVRGSLPFSYEYDDGDDDTTLVATVQTSAGLLTAYLTLDVEASIAAGGGGGGTTDRGTLYLRASVTGASLNTASVATGDGAVMAFELDPDKTSTGDFWTQTEDGFSLDDISAYAFSIATKGTAHYPGGVPDLVNIDVYDNVLTGVNVGHSSDGSDDSDSFTPQINTPLPLLIKEGIVPGNLAFHTYPYDMLGFVVDNNGDVAVGATLDLEARLSLTQIWAGERYTEADFS